MTRGLNANTANASGLQTKRWDEDVQFSELFDNNLELRVLLLYSQVQATEHSFADNPNPPERQARL